MIIIYFVYFVIFILAKISFITIIDFLQLYKHYFKIIFYFFQLRYLHSLLHQKHVCMEVFQDINLNKLYKLNHLYL
jgi:hypothetical protein